MPVEFTGERSILNSLSQLLIHMEKNEPGHLPHTLKLQLDF